MTNPKTFITYLLLLVGFSVTAQYTDVINSNRPGASTSAYSVGKRVIQFELGSHYLKEAHTPLKTKNSGLGINFSGRYGLLLEQLEVNIDLAYQNDKFKDNRSVLIEKEAKRSGFRHLAIGAKYLVYDPYKKLAEEKPNLYSYHDKRKFKWKHLIPAVSVYAGLNFDAKNNVFVPYTNPFYSPDYKGGLSPKLTIATQHNFSNGWVVVMNFMKDRFGSEYSDFQYLLTVTKALNQQWVLFGETQAISNKYYADNLFKVGAAYLMNNNLQFDTTLTSNTKDTPSVFSLNFGASYRLDFHKDPHEEINNDIDLDDQYTKASPENGEEEAGGKKKKKKKRKKRKKRKQKDSDLKFETEEGPSKRKKEVKEINFEDEE